MSERRSSKSRKAPSESTNKTDNNVSEVFVLPPELLQKLGINLQSIQHTPEVKESKEINVHSGQKGHKKHKDRVKNAKNYTEHSPTAPMSKGDTSILETANLMKSSVFLSPTFQPSITNATVSNAEIDLSTLSQDILRGALDPAHDNSMGNFSGFESGSNSELGSGLPSKVVGIENTAITNNKALDSVSSNIQRASGFLQNEPHTDLYETKANEPKNLPTPIIISSGIISEISSPIMSNAETKFASVSNKRNESKKNKNGATCDSNVTKSIRSPLLRKNREECCSRSDNHVISPLKGYQTNTAHEEIIPEPNLDIGGIILDQCIAPLCDDKIASSKDLGVDFREESNIESPYDDHLDEAYMSDCSNSNVGIGVTTEGKSEIPVNKVKILSEEIVQPLRLNEIFYETKFYPRGEKLVPLSINSVVSLNHKSDNSNIEIKDQDDNRFPTEIHVYKTKELLETSEDRIEDKDPSLLTLEDFGVTQNLTFCKDMDAILQTEMINIVQDDTQQVEDELKTPVNMIDGLEMLYEASNIIADSKFVIEFIDELNQAEAASFLDNPPKDESFRELSYPHINIPCNQSVTDVHTYDTADKSTLETAENLMISHPTIKATGIKSDISMKYDTQCNEMDIPAIIEDVLSTPKNKIVNTRGREQEPLKLRNITPCVMSDNIENQESVKETSGKEINRQKDTSDLVVSSSKKADKEDYAKIIIPCNNHVNENSQKPITDVISQTDKTCSSDKVDEIASYLEKCAHFLTKRHKYAKSIHAHEGSITKKIRKNSSSISNTNEGVEKPGSLTRKTCDFRTGKTYKRSSKKPRPLILYCKNESDMLENFEQAKDFTTLDPKPVDYAKIENQYCICGDFGHFNYDDYDIDDLYQHPHFLKSSCMSCRPEDSFSGFDYIEYIETKTKNQEQETIEETPHELHDYICWKQHVETGQHDKWKYFENSVNAIKSSMQIVTENSTETETRVISEQRIEENLLVRAKFDFETEIVVEVVESSQDIISDHQIKQTSGNTEKEYNSNGDISPASDNKSEDINKSVVMNSTIVPIDPNPNMIHQNLKNINDPAKPISQILKAKEMEAGTSGITLTNAPSKTKTNSRNSCSAVNFETETTLKTPTRVMKRKRSSVTNNSMADESVQADGLSGTEVVSPERKKSFKCGVCKKLLSFRMWADHIAKEHCFIAWQDGESIDTTSKDLLRNLNAKLKAGESLQCTFCHVESKRSSEFISHIRQCIDKQKKYDNNTLKDEPKKKQLKDKSSRKSETCSQRSEDVPHILKAVAELSCQKSSHRGDSAKDKNAKQKHVTHSTKESAQKSPEVESQTRRKSVGILQKRAQDKKKTSTEDDGTTPSTLTSGRCTVSDKCYSNRRKSEGIMKKTDLSAEPACQTTESSNDTDKQDDNRGTRRKSEGNMRSRRGIVLATESPKTIQRETRQPNEDRVSETNALVVRSNIIKQAPKDTKRIGPSKVTVQVPQHKSIDHVSAKNKLDESKSKPEVAGHKRRHGSDKKPRESTEKNETYKEIRCSTNESATNTGKLYKSNGNRREPDGATEQNNRESYADITTSDHKKASPTLDDMKTGELSKPKRNRRKSEGTTSSKTGKTVPADGFNKSCTESGNSETMSNRNIDGSIPNSETKICTQDQNISEGNTSNVPISIIKAVLQADYVKNPITFIIKPEKAKSRSRKSDKTVPINAKDDSIISTNTKRLDSTSLDDSVNNKEKIKPEENSTKSEKSKRARNSYKKNVISDSDNSDAEVAESMTSGLDDSVAVNEIDDHQEKSKKYKNIKPKPRKRKKQVFISDSDQSDTEFVEPLTTCIDYSIITTEEVDTFQDKAIDSDDLTLDKHRKTKSAEKDVASSSKSGRSSIEIDKHEETLKPSKRKRGRPKKNIANISEANEIDVARNCNESISIDEINLIEERTRKPRKCKSVRPKKNTTDDFDELEQPVNEIEKPVKNVKRVKRPKNYIHDLDTSENITKNLDNSSTSIKNDDSGTNLEDTVIGLSTDASDSVLGDTCGVCNEVVTSEQWVLHIQTKHKYIAWRVGEQPIDRKDETEFFRRMNAISKKYGGLVCSKCGYIRIKAKEYLNHFDVCDVAVTESSTNPASTLNTSAVTPLDVLLKSNSKVTCGVCSTEVATANWCKHASDVHYDIAWPVGAPEIDIKNPYAVDRILKQYKMSGKLFVCKVCGTGRASAIGFYAHVLTCGKTEEEIEKFKEECTICNQMFLCIYKQQHYAMHRQTENKAKRRAEQAERDQEMERKRLEVKEAAAKGTKGRRAALMARSVIEDYNNSLNQCRYQCTDCEFGAETQKELAEHSCREEAEAVVESEDEAESEESVDSDISEQAEEEAQRRRKRKKQSQALVIRPHVEMPFKVANVNKYISQGYKDFCAYHYAREELFPEWKSLQLEPVLEDEIAQYLPPIEESCKLDTEQGWSTIKRFDVLQMGKASVLFTGASPHCVAWAPPRYSSDDVTDDSYLAVATHHGADTPRFSWDETREHPGFISIWNFGLFNRSPSLALGLCHSLGAVWALAWCPSGVRAVAAPGSRLGLLAAAGSGGRVCILPVPYPPDGEHKNNIFYKVKPVAELHLSMIDNSRSCQSTSLSWSTQKGHAIITVGYSDGTVASYDLSCESPLGRSERDGVTIIYPYHDERLHKTCITGVATFPSLQSGSDAGCAAAASTTNSYVRAGGAARATGGSGVAALAFTPLWPSVMLGTDDQCQQSELEWFGSIRRLGPFRSVCACARCGQAACALPPLVRLFSPHPASPDLKRKNFVAIEMVPLAQKRHAKEMSALATKLEPRTYEEAVVKYGVQLRYMKKGDPVRTRPNDRFIPDRFPLADVTSLAFCLSPSYHHKLAVATHSGLLFLLSSPRKPERNE